MAADLGDERLGSCDGAGPSPDAGAPPLLVHAVLGRLRSAPGGGAMPPASELWLRLRPAGGTPGGGDVVALRAASGGDGYVGMLAEPLSLPPASVMFEVGADKERWVCGVLRRSPQGEEAPPPEGGGGGGGGWAMERTPLLDEPPECAPELTLELVGRCGGEAVCVSLCAPVQQRAKRASHGAPPLEAIGEDEVADSALGRGLRALHGAAMAGRPAEEELRRSFEEALAQVDAYNFQGRGGGAAEDSTWFRVGLRLGVGVGLGATLGLGLGIGLLNRAWQRTAAAVTQGRGAITRTVLGR